MLCDGAILPNTALRGYSLEYCTIQGTLALYEQRVSGSLRSAHTAEPIDRLIMEMHRKKVSYGRVTLTFPKEKMV